MSKYLQNYFDAAKQQAPLLTEKEVANLLNAAPKVVVKKRSLNLKRFVFMSTLSVMITAIWLMWNNQNVSTIKPQAAISLKQVAPTQPQPNNTNGLIEKPVLNRLQLSQTKPQQATPDSLNKPQAPNNWFEPLNSNSYNEPQEPAREYFNENGELILTHEELAKLGIMTDGNVLSYENVVDTSSKWITPIVAGISDTGFYSFKLLVSGKGSKFTHRSINRTEIKLKSKLFWPAVIETKTDRDTSYDVVEYINDRQNNNKIFFNEIKPFCVPVRVEFITQLKHTSYLFWFKAQQSFINELPVKAADLLQPKVNQVDISEYQKILDSYSTLKSWTKLKDMLGEKKIDQLQKNIIKLDKEGYQKLKISKTINSFKYVNNIYENQTKRRLIISSKRKQQYIEIGTPKNNITQKDTLIQVVALTNKSFDYSMFFYLNNNALSQSKTLELNTKRFAKECDDLIPIQVTSNMVLWFRPTNYLMDVVSNHQISDNFTLEKSRLVRLTENELAKLNITYTSEGVRVPIHIDKTSSIYSVYKNYESTHDMVGFKVVEKDGTPTFEPDSLAKNTAQNAKVSTPVLITSLDGIGWRAYEYDIDNFIDPKEVAYMQEHNLSPEKHQPYIEAVEKAKQALIEELSTMLPIAIVHPTLKNTGVIAWYRTDSTLFNLLPAELAIDIKREANAITNNQQTPTCKYFETCNTAGMLYDVYAFPNPTEQMVTVEIEAMEPRNYSIVLTDIEGKVVKTLTKNKTLKSGKHQLSFDLADMAPGMYLLQVNTQYNELTVKRIIKK